jgi:pyrrolysyl-tRNA synthetase-like protein
VEQKVSISWTDIQQKRLHELGAPESIRALFFSDEADRNRTYQKIEHDLVISRKQALEALRSGPRRPKRALLEDALIHLLIEEEFVQVTTPTLMAKGLLKKMGIVEGHPLNDQIYWVDRDKCLRPMLAPHLYYVVKDLLRLWEKPVRIFEMGSCFRKETQGAAHTAEFTMLNLCEFGLPAEEREERLNHLAHLVLKVAGIDDYVIQTETSVVYGSTIDVMTPRESLEIELASGAMGPHPLDAAWKITDTWIGIGFGLERLLMTREKTESIAPLVRSITYLDGIRLNV